MSAGWFDNASFLQSPYKMNMTEDYSSIRSNNKQGLSSVLNSDSFNNNSPFSSSNTINYNYNNSSTHNSIRRTLSAADMASQKWLTPFKRVHSSVQLQVLGEDQRSIGENHDDCNNSNNTGGQAFEEIWSSIQADKKSWGSILSPGKTDGSGSGSGQVPPPYVHPLAKRSASSLSEKSLEICTESLGSETGSDGFSYPPLEPEDEHEEEEDMKEKEEDMKEKEEEQEEVEEKGSSVVEVGNYKCNNNSSSLMGPTVKRSMMVPPVRPSFPPPLPSLAHRNDGSNLHIRSHRQDGRLVVEAVAVPSQNCLRAQRQDGRLLLTLSTGTIDQQVHEYEPEHEQMFEAAAEEVDEEEEEDEGEEEVLAIPTRGLMNVQQRSCTGFTMSKLMELTNTRNKSTWPRKYNKTVIKTLDDNNEEEVEDEEVDELTVTQSSLLPPQPRVSTATAAAAAVALNAYEYYWRRSNSPAAAAVARLNPLVGHKNKNNNNKNCALQVEKDSKRNNNNKLLYAAHNRKGVALAQAQQQDVVLLKAAGIDTGTGGATAAEKTENLLPLMLRGCKEPKRSLLFWEPPCIATS